MKRLILPIFLMAAVQQASPMGPRLTCPAISTSTVPDGKLQRDVTRTERFLFYRAGLRVNTDGAPNSYHPIGTSGAALNSICNGIAVYPAVGVHRGKRISAVAPKDISDADRCQMILDIFRASRAVDYEPVASGKIDWFAIALDQDPSSPRIGKPCIQDAGKFMGFFVAQTKLPADPKLGSCEPGRWVDSTIIPYITLPGGSKAFADAGANPGDLALVHRRVGRQDLWVVAVIADTGNSNELGEGSIALHHALGHMTSGRARHPGNLQENITTFIFPDKNMSVPITQSAIADPRLREQIFSYASGEETLQSCTQ